MARAYLSYDGTDIPIDLRAAMIRKRRERAINERMWKAALATVGFWYEMYKKRLDKYKKLKNSLIDIHHAEM